MPNSLKCKIKHLCHNGTITERERDRIIKALEQEPILDKIRAEIDFEENWLSQVGYNERNVDIAFNAIKRVISESEE